MVSSLVVNVFYNVIFIYILHLIKHTSYVFVHRYPHYRVNGFVWLFGCSCDRLRLEFVQALSSNTNLSTDKGIQDY